MAPSRALSKVPQRLIERPSVGRYLALHPEVLTGCRIQDLVIVANHLRPAELVKDRVRPAVHFLKFTTDACEEVSTVLQFSKSIPRSQWMIDIQAPVQSFPEAVRVDNIRRLFVMPLAQQREIPNVIRTSQGNSLRMCALDRRIPADHAGRLIQAKVVSNRPHGRLACPIHRVTIPHHRAPSLSVRVTNCQLVGYIVTLPQVLDMGQWSVRFRRNGMM